jgi:hypothetical protein
MTRARYRAFKCRQGVHRWHQRTEIDDGLFWKTCRDCRLSVSHPVVSRVDVLYGFAVLRPQYPVSWMSAGESDFPFAPVQDA